MLKILLSILFLFLSLNNLSALALSSKEIYKKYSSSILLIFSEDNYEERKSINYGTAFAIDKSGLLLTSAHLVKNNSLVKDENGKVFPIIDIIWQNAQADLALIKVVGNFQPLPLANSLESEVGEELSIISNPSGFQNTLSTGILSSRRKSSSNSLVQLQYTNPISPGSSGGPVFNENGKVIGIVQGIYVNQHTQNLNFGIPIEYIPSKYLHANKEQFEEQFEEQKQDNNNSLVAYNKLLQDIHPNSAEDYVLRGLLKQKLHDYIGAIQDFKAAQWLIEREMLELSSLSKPSIELGNGY